MDVNPSHLTSSANLPAHSGPAAAPAFEAERFGRACAAADVAREKIKKEIGRLIRLRAIARARRHPQSREVETYDSLIRSTLDENKPLIQLAPDEVIATYYKALNYYQEQYAGAVMENLSALAEKIGVCFGRDFQRRTLEKAEKRFEQYLKRHGRLAQQCLNFNECVAELRERGIERGIALRLEAESRAANIHSSLCRWIGKDTDEVIKSLTTDEEMLRRLISKAFKERYGENLPAFLQRCMSGPLRSKALNLAKGDLIGAAADSLFVAFTGYLGLFADREATIAEVYKDIYKTIPEGQAAAVEERLMSEYGARINRDKFARTFADNPFLAAWRSGNRVLAHAFLINKALVERPISFIVIPQVLEKYPPDPSPEQASQGVRPLEALLGAYRSAIGRDLPADLRTAMPDGAARHWALSYLSRDELQVSPAKLRCAIEEIKAGRKWINRIKGDHQHGKGAGELCIDVLYGRSDEERARIKRGYRGVYHHSFEEDLRRTARRRERRLLLCLSERGYIPREELFLYFVVGYGRDDHGIKTTLQKMGAEELERAKAAFPRICRNWWNRKPQSLERRIAYEVSRRPDIMELLHPEPADLPASYEKVTRRWMAERRSTLLPWINRRFHLLERLAGDGEIMNRDFQRLNDAIQRARHKHVVEIAEDRQIRSLIRLVRTDCDLFREAKVALANRTSAFTSRAALLGFAAYAWWTHNPLGVFPIALAASIASRLSLKKTFKSDYYGLEEIVRDLFWSTVDCLTLYAAKIEASPLFKKVVPRVSKLGFKHILDVVDRADDLRAKARITGERDVCERPINRIRIDLEARENFFANGWDQGLIKALDPIGR